MSLAAAPPIVIQNATILTVTKGTIEKGSVLVRDGKIVEIGQRVNVPAGATVIDGTGKFLMPGIIDCHSHIAAEAINEGSVSVSSMVGIQDVLNPEDIAIYRALAGGVTTANILHGSANSIGGKCQVIKTRWGKPASGLVFEGAMPGIKFALGENPEAPRRVARPKPRASRRESSALPGNAHGRGRYHSRSVQRREGISGHMEVVRGRKG